MAEASSIKCPACGAPLRFDAASGKQVCDWCNSAFEIPVASGVTPSVAQGTGASASTSAGTDAGASAYDNTASVTSLQGVSSEFAQQQAAQGNAFYQEYNLDSADQQATIDANYAAPILSPEESYGKNASGSFDWGPYAKELMVKDFEDVKTYVCSNCAAEVVATEVTAATTCPYCNNNVVLDERLSGGLKPNAIIPFAISKDELPELLQNFYKDKPLLPKDFFAANKVERAQGIYVPFWLFSATVDGTIVYNATVAATFFTKKEQVIQTSHYRLNREGSVRFAQVPVDASVRMDNDTMDSLEPFDFSKMVEYRPEYLTGFVADRFDSSAEDEINRASIRMHNSAIETFRGTCRGEGVTQTESNLVLQDASVQYVLLPVYLFNCTYGGQSWHYAINGQTGKVIGEVPVSKSKKLRSFFIPAGITFVALSAIMLVLQAL